MWMGRGILIIAGIVALAAAGAVVFGTTRSEGPQQPIPFPHDIHAGTNNVPCLYCHSSAAKSVDAGLPAVEVCAGCHIPGGVPLVAADSPGVRTLISYWNAKEPIPWVRIHDLPDHVHFPHMIHVNADSLECQQCHGQVEAMAEITLQQPLRMGWCLQCHRERGVRTDCTVCHY